MNIPADIPSPDQENVYYSVKSLVGELVKHFDSDSISKVADTVKEFYLPVFVFDDTNAPNTFQIDVYPRGGKKANILLDSAGTVLVNNISAVAAIPLTSDNKLNDGGLKTTIDSSFYSNSKLKSQDMFADLEYDDESDTGLEILLASKFWMNSDVKQTIMSRNQYIELIKSIAKSAFASLPEKEIEIIKSVYKAKQEDISQIVNIVDEIKIGQVKTLDSIKFNSLAEKVYPELGIQAQVDEQSELRLTRANIAQSLVQLNNSRSPAFNRYSKASQLTNKNSTSITTNPTFLKNSPTKGYSLVWNGFVQKCIDNGHIKDTKLESLIAGQISNGGDELNSILQFEGKNTFVEENGNSSWINEWYYNNFAKVLIGKETDFSGLESFLEEYQTTLDQVEKTAKLNVLGGGFMLVHHAILKSLLKLCQSNVDVSEYAPVIGTTDIFTQMGRSSVLGPSGCHQAPSKHSQAEDEYTISGFSKTGFLCYQAITKIVTKLKGKPSSRQFLLENASIFDSDHDKVIKLWSDISGYGNTSKQSIGIGHTLHANSQTSQNTLDEDKKVAHLYTINETFEGDEIYLIPLGDVSVGKSERTFINYNLPGIRHTTEETFIALSSMPEVDGLKPLSEDDSALVKSDGSLNVSMSSKAYKNMGYNLSIVLMGPNSTPVDPAPYSRNSRVHYGITNPDNWTDKEQEEKSVFDFFKQKNYNLPYFWASTTSIYKALIVETYKELLGSLNDILGTNIELTYDDLLTQFNNDWLLTAIETTITSLNSMNRLKAKSYVRVDGTITFTDDIEKQDNLARAWATEYRNTSGDNTSTLVKNYIKFTSLVSDYSSIQTVEEHKPISYDYSIFVPPEVLSTSTNPNYQNIHGGFSAYISDTFDEYYDPLEFRDIEYKDNSIIKKNMTGIGVENEFNSFYSDYITQARGMRQHVLFNKGIISAFNEFKAFISGFSIPESAIDIFSTGNINIKNDIKNPQRMIDQIKSNKELYSADAKGISQKWNKIAIEDVNSFASSSSNWLYVYVVGIDSNEFVNGEVKIVPTYIGSSGNEIELISNLKTSWSFGVNKPIGTKADPLEGDELESELVLNYLHLVRGIDLSETTFSYKSDRLYEEHIINSESGIFPWDADSFEEGIPKEPIDPIFNMSPWVYPTNYFYDVCISNEFKRVVACVIKEEHINGLEVDSISVGSIQEIIGSIRWKIKEE
jgi:hypothetical protein